MRTYCTCILASINRVLYVGVTNDLERGVYQHRIKKNDGFTSRYNVNRLVWYRAFRDVRDAIKAEKRIKGWTRAKKVALIEESNPGWEDISASWPAPDRPAVRVADNTLDRADAAPAGESRVAQIRRAAPALQSEPPHDPSQILRSTSG